MAIKMYGQFLFRMESFSVYLTMPCRSLSIGYLNVPRRSSFSPPPAPITLTSDL